MPNFKLDSSNDEEIFFTIYEGQDKRLPLRAFDSISRDPLDISKATEITARFLGKVNNVTKSLSDGPTSIQITNGPKGRYLVILNPTDTAALQYVDRGTIEVVFDLPSPIGVVVIQYPKSIQVLPRMGV